MRIGIVIAEFDPQSGGMGQWCWQFVSALADGGHTVHLIARRIAESSLPVGVIRHIVPAVKTRLSFAQAAAEHVGKLELDIVHDMGAGWSCDIFQPHGGSHFAFLARRADMYPGWFWAIKSRVDLLLPRHRDAMRHCRQQFLPRYSVGKTFLALSHSVAGDFVNFHGVRPEQIAIVPNGVDCRRYSPEHRARYRQPLRRQLGVADDTVLLLLAAHNWRLKGVAELLAAAGRLAVNGRPVHVAIAGGKRPGIWRRVAARCGLENRVTFAGAVHDMVPYYAAADAYVHPTYYDPCSLVLLEAAASGLPIVTTRRYNGAAELFRDGQEIMTVADPSAADALYECVDALFEESVRTKLGTAAREVALRHPFERNVADILGLYERTLTRRLAA